MDRSARDARVRRSHRERLSKVVIEEEGEIMRRKLAVISFLLVLVGLTAPAFASHFRFGHITWTRPAGSRTVTFNIVSAWRTDPTNFPNTVLGDSLNPISFGDGSNYSGGLAGGQNVTTATGVDSGGVGFTIRSYTLTHTFAGTGTTFNVVAAGSARLSTIRNSPDSPYQVTTVVDLRNAGETGSPVSSIPVILQFAKGARDVPQLYALPIADPNGHPFTCSLAPRALSGLDNQPFTSVSGFVRALSVSSNCVISWDTSDTVAGQRYAAQVLITSGGATDITTRVALDFVIEIQNTVSNAAPACSGFSGTATISYGTELSSDFTGTDTDLGDLLTIGSTILPAGATLSPAAGTTGTSPRVTTFSWTPTIAQVGSYALNISFTDSHNLSAQCPFAIQVVNPDTDGDGTPDNTDNCPTVANAGQADLDADGVGDACDPDIDGDGVANGDDNCTVIPNPGQDDYDVDGQGDVCDGDDDGDGVLDGDDNCVLAVNPGQENNDGDGLGDVCDDDDDDDGIGDAPDNCDFDSNPDQADNDVDGRGDVCDNDDDNDGVLDGGDNCPLTANPQQLDNDADGLGDACDGDDDGDGVGDATDNCPLQPNGTQLDTDGDGAGDLCDDDDDGDGVDDGGDNCPLAANGDQPDTDGDGAGNACDGDDDGDGVGDPVDNCALTPNADQLDSDGDGAGNPCDGDDDGDGVGDGSDGCPLVHVDPAHDANHDGCPDLAADLCSLVHGMNLAQGTETSLCAKASAAAKASSAGTAANILDAFIAEVAALTNKKIAPVYAAILTAFATNAKLNL
jgi:hypothetical protein